jgi:hypothetical protein
MPFEQNLSFIKDRVLPKFFTEGYPNFVKFIEMWLDWCSERGQAYWNLSNLENFTSIDDTVDEFYKEIKKELVADFPDQIVAESKTFLKNVSHIYRTKGIEECYRLIFRIFWGVDIQISYPSEKILRVSDNSWIQEKFITTVDLSLQELIKMPGCLIIGQASETTAVVKNLAFINVLEGDEFPNYVLTLENLSGSFVDGETIRVIGGNADMHGTVFTVEYFMDRPGYWESTESFLSTDKVLQDNYYWQDFSYVVTTTIPINDWYRLILKLLHPAGLKIFGRFVVSLGGGGEQEPVLTPDVLIAFKLWILKMTDWMETGVDMNRKWKRIWTKFFEIQVDVLRKFVRSIFHEFETKTTEKEKRSQVIIVKELISGVEFDRGWQRIRPHSEASVHKLSFGCDKVADFSDNFIVADFSSKKVQDVERRFDYCNQLVFSNGKFTRTLFQ